MSDYESRMKIEAERWSNAKTEELRLKDVMEEAQRVYESARHDSEVVEDELSECVGNNISRRCFKVERGIVLIQHNGSRGVVSLEKLI